MRLRSVHIRGFRSIEMGHLAACGGLNVLIGKNNSGKSNLLGTIDLVHQHLARGTIAGPWPVSRPGDEFTDRNCEEPLQIGVEFDFPSRINTDLRNDLKAVAPHLERSIDELTSQDRLSFILAGTIHQSGAFLWVQSIAAGSISVSNSGLQVNGIQLLEVPAAAAAELFSAFKEAADLRTRTKALDELTSEPHRLEMIMEREASRFYFGREFSPDLLREVTNLVSSASDRDDLAARIRALRDDYQSKIDSIGNRKTEFPIRAFAGETNAPPQYALSLMKSYGANKMLHLKETREAIGRDEANALLSLKVTRGGPERLSTVQQTVKALLGVNVDAFQADDVRAKAGLASAEIDIDQFLVDANGAGVREALRLVLDLELKEPDLVLIEEPEVHLHPGLEHAVYQYLRDKSERTQIFVTTHSTNFVDSVSFQNIYLVSKDERRRTVINTLDTGDGALKIPAELGLRLSTVFMFDRLVFVEGPSDEAILRELFKIQGIDLASANVGFVQMGGVRNFAHFAAQSTLELLAKRQIRLWFVADRDERDDADVQRMLEKLGENAVLHVLERREIENYLLDSAAIHELIIRKRRSLRLAEETITREMIDQAIEEEARRLRGEVERLRLSRTVLAPVYLIGRQVTGEIGDRIDSAIATLQQRKDTLEEVRGHITAELDKDWNATATARAPGAAILSATMQRFETTFSKDGGDSARLAMLLTRDRIPAEISALLTDIAGTSPLRS